MPISHRSFTLGGILIFSVNRALNEALLLQPTTNRYTQATTLQPSAFKELIVARRKIRAQLQRKRGLL